MDLQLRQSPMGMACLWSTLCQLDSIKARGSKMAPLTSGTLVLPVGWARMLLHVASLSIRRAWLPHIAAQGSKGVRAEAARPFKALARNWHWVIFLALDWWKQVIRPAQFQKGGNTLHLLMEGAACMYRMGRSLNTINHILFLPFQFLEVKLVVFEFQHGKEEMESFR